MHLFHFFPRIQSLRDLGIISARQLPVESFLHNAWVFGCLGEFCLTLHAVVPLRFFLSLPLSPPPHNPLYQNLRNQRQQSNTASLCHRYGRCSILAEE